MLCIPAYFSCHATLLICLNPNPYTYKRKDEQKKRRNEQQVQVDSEVKIKSSAVNVLKFNEFHNTGLESPVGSPESFYMTIGTKFALTNLLWMESEQCLFATTLKQIPKCWIYRIRASQDERYVLDNHHHQELKIGQWQEITTPPQTIYGTTYSNDQGKLVVIVLIRNVGYHVVRFTTKIYSYDFHSNRWIKDNNSEETNKIPNASSLLLARAREIKSFGHTPYIYSSFKKQSRHDPEDGFSSNGIKSNYRKHGLPITHGLNFGMKNVHGRAIPMHLFGKQARLGIHLRDTFTNYRLTNLTKFHILLPDDEENATLDPDMSVKTLKVQHVWFEQFEMRMYIIFEVTYWRSSKRYYSHHVLYYVNPINDMRFYAEYAKIVIEKLTFVSFYDKSNIIDDVTISF